MHIITNHQDIFCIYICVAAGSIYENNKQAGMSHVLEHMLLKRTKQYSENVLIDKIAELGGIANASTDKDITCFYILTTSENWKKAINIMASVIKFPEINKKECDLEKNVIIQELNMRKDNFQDCYNLGISTLLCKTNIYNNTVEGTVPKILNLDIKELIAYYKLRYDKYCVTVNCPYSMKANVQKYVHQKFGKLDTIYDNDSELKNSSCFQNKIDIIYRDKKQFTHLFLFKAFSKKEYKKTIITNFIRFAFINGSFKSKLMYILRTKLGLVYSISSGNESYRYLGIMTLEMSTTVNNVDKILKIVLDLLDEIKKEGLTQHDLNFYKKAYLSSRKIVFADELFKTSWHSENSFYNVKLTEKQYEDIIINMTNEEIKSCCNELFDVSKMGLLSYGNYNSSKKLIYGLKKIISLHKSEL
jgi:predicted Zn-dependent peptidase